MSGIELKIFSYIPAIVGLLLIGLFVILNNTTSVKNKIFSLLNLVVAIWLSFLFIADTATNNTTALWALRFGLFFGQVVFLLFFFFASEFPFKTKLSNLSRFALSLPTILLALGMLTPLGVITVSIKSFGVQPEHIGPLYALSDFVGIGYMLLGFGLLINKYRKSEAQQRSQITSVLIGLLIVVIANIFSGLVATLLRVDSGYIWVGSFSLFIFSLLVTYSIIRHNFLDIKLIVARSVAYILLFSTLITAYSFFILGVSRFFFATSLSPIQQVANVTFALLLAITFHPLRLFFNRITNKLFYRDAYDSQAILDQIGDIVVRETHLKDLLHDTLKPLHESLKVQFSRFILINDLGDISHIALMGVSKADFTALMEELNGVKSSLVLVDLLEDKSVKLRKAAQHAGVAVIVRLETSNGLIGYLMLGNKQSGSNYNSQDVGLLNVASNELAVSIENALRFQEIQDFNKTLQTRIEEATRELRANNKKLHALDIAKDEFISMASHQLRTPLTTVKGYLSMVLEGDAGELEAKQRKLLEEAYSGAQRMVYLIGDFLNVSRLQTGKFVIEASKVNLAEVVAEEVEQLQETAKARQLELVYSRPDEFPVVKMDETKIRQVVMNFIDNAIFYSRPKNVITIELVATEKEITLRVRDHGIGVPASERHHLFTKFYRASNARKVRPDGTGIGIFMAKKVIMAHGGSIIFETVEGKGSTFGFRLPRQAVITSEKRPLGPVQNQARE
jgi:signal transduction histidine kinase